MKEATSAAGWECSRTANLVESGCGVIARKSWWRKRKGGRAVGEKFMGVGCVGMSLSDPWDARKRRHLYGAVDSEEQYSSKQ